MALVRKCLTDIECFAEIRLWDRAILEAQEAIDYLEDIQLCAAEQRSKAIDDYCKAHPGYVPF
jgi:hypothetical protein